MVMRYSGYDENRRYGDGSKCIDTTLDELVLEDFRPSRANENTAIGMGDYAGASKFYNGWTLPTARAKMAEYQPSAMVQKLRDLISDEFAPDTKATRRRRLNHREWGERVGDSVEYERFHTGITFEQHFWERHERKERPHVGEITLHVNVGIMGSEPSSALDGSGATALAMTDLLEDMGYRVALYAVSSHGVHSVGSLHHRVLLKGADERLSQQAMAYVCEAGCYRAVEFPWMDSLPFEIGFGHGYPRLYDGPAKADLTVPKRVNTFEDAATWIREELNKLRKEDQ